MKVVDIDRVVILMRFIQYGWDEERKKAFDDNLRMMLETQCEDLAEHDEQIRAEAYNKGATDMEKAKQIIIDSLLEQIEKITKSLPTCDRYNDYCCPNSIDDCFDCMMESIDKIKENLGLKERNK